MLEESLRWLAVALLGGLVGGSELVSRYRDAPVNALRTAPGFWYITFNVVASLGAYSLVLVFDWRFGLPESTAPAAAAWTRVLLSGMSAMALFRTSLFVIRAGDKDIGVGPSSFLQIFLTAADREVDRERAVVRSTVVSKLMAGADYRKAFTALPPYCLALMQNLPDDIQKDLRQALETLDRAPMDDQLKARLLGLELVNVVGVDVLRQAIGSLGEEIQAAKRPHETPAARRAAPGQ